jgi:O-antigen/teichoic acid export membrane protein
MIVALWAIVAMLVVVSSLLYSVLVLMRSWPPRDFGRQLQVIQELLVESREKR